MGEEPPVPRRTPGGALPRRLGRPRHPDGNGLTPAPPAEPPSRQAWERLGAEDEQRLDAERTAFRRVAEIVPEVEVRASGRPTTVVVVATLVVVAIVVLAVVLYRMAPP